MLQTTLAAPTADASLANDASGAELRLAMLKRLASLGMRVAEEVAERMVNSPYHPEPRHEPARAFAAVSRAVRLTIVLEARVEADLFALRRGEVPKISAAPAPRPHPVARTSDDDEEDVDDDGGVEAVARERTWECLVDREDDEALLDRPFDEAVAAIRADLQAAPAVETLLPLREKVAAKPTDEGFRRPLRQHLHQLKRTELVDPSSDPLRVGRSSPARGEGYGPPPVREQDP